ncbi:hypothetical protein SAMD00019534_076680, partial [Acytostelium subglobosum LB1]|uniref:hypothetical protein n=1 Tax=Acytostelium subglobosum LB1 TaxID=1410327 RepID=UPI000644E94B
MHTHTHNTPSKTTTTTITSTTRPSPPTTVPTHVIDISYTLTLLLSCQRHQSIKPVHPSIHQSISPSPQPSFIHSVGYHQPPTPSFLLFPLLLQLHSTPLLIHSFIHSNIIQYQRVASSAAAASATAAATSNLGIDCIRWKSTQSIYQVYL